MDESYKIQLGVDIDISDLQSQINKAGDKVSPIPIKVEIENLNEIKKQLQNLGGTNSKTKIDIPIDTASIKNDFKEVSSSIKEIKNAIGTLDSKSGMQSLLSSINQISSALDKASNKFDELNANMNALASKDFSLNIGVKLGGSNSVSNNAAYGNIVKSEIIPELKRQEQAIGRYLAQYYKTDELSALNKLAGNSLGGMRGIIETLDRLEQPVKKGDSLNDRMREYQDFFKIVQKAASIQGVDLSPVLSGFDKQADELIQGAHDIRNGTKEAEESVNKFEDVLKRAFGSGINSEQLDSIIQDLKEIKVALTDLSAETPLNQLKTSFDQLSKSITQLIQNCGNIKTAFNDVGNAGENVGTNVGRELADGFDNGMETIKASATETSGVITKLKSTLETMKLDRSSIDAITNDIKELGFEVTDASVKMKDGNFDITVKGIDSLGRAITEMRHLDSEAGEISGLGRTISQSFSTSDDVVRELNKEMANFVKLETQISNMKTKIGKLEIAGGNENQIAELKRQLEDLEDTYARLMQTFSKKLVANADIVSMDDIARFDDEIAAATERAEAKLREFDAKYADTQAKLIRNKLSGSDLGASKFDNEILDITTKFGKLSTQSSELKSDIDQLRTTFSQLKSIAKTDDINALIQANANYEEVLRSVNSQLKQQQVIEQQDINKAALEQSKAKLSLEMDNWLKDNSAAAKDFGIRVKELQSQINSCDKQGLTHLKAQFINIQKEAQLAGKNTQTFGDKIKAQFSKYSSYLSVASLFSYASQGLRDMFQQVVAIDTAMTELKKVTDETDASYNKFLTNAAKRSKELGTTIDGLVESAADFARLGYGFDEAQGLAEVANIYAVVGDEIDGVGQATESLISTMAAFKAEMNGMSDSDFAMSIIDKFNEVGKIMPKDMATYRVNVYPVAA